MPTEIENNITYRVLSIVRGTTVDGPGFRTAIYLAGCSHNCPGCHNPQSHNPMAGDTMTVDELLHIVEEEDFDVTLTGGDPLYAPESLYPLLAGLRTQKRNIWLYTGYQWEEIISDPRLLKAASMSDVIVDGLFVKERHNPDLLFRGSDNQRLIDVPKSLKSGHVALYSPS